MSFACVPARNVTPNGRKASIVLAANSINSSATSSIVTPFGGIQAVSAAPPPAANALAAAAHGRRAAREAEAAAASSSINPALAASSNNLGGFLISGQKTGEEKFVSATDVRRPQDENTNADLQARRVNQRTASNAATTDAERIRKLEQELRKSQETVRKKSAEIESMREKQKQALADLSAKHDKERLEALEAQKQQHDEAAKALILQVDKLNGQVARLQVDLKTKSAEENEAARRRDGELSASTKLWASERGVLQTEIDKLRKQLQSETERNGQLASEARTAALNLETAKSDWARLEQQLRAELAAALKEIRELKATIEQQRENVAEWERRVKACNSFILQICQPKFSVVKDDEKLTPMSQAEAAAAAGQAGGASGFVLVPLVLMLDAYELLPKDAKQTIATKYEQDKKSRGQ